MTTADGVAAQSQIDPGKILTFPQGIPGFEKYTKFNVFHKEENNISAYWLESCDAPKVTFTLVDPTIYGLNYELDLSEEEQKVLGTDDPFELAVLMMLSKSEDVEGRQSTLNANIAGPIIVNPKTRIGLQKVIVCSQANVNIIRE
ncbi:MAG: flagellar assembly protein FliW [Desulfoprunum sp.]|nr:flagellar assembly protein FliW [Desulfoprunum sp.]